MPKKHNPGCGCCGVGAFVGRIYADPGPPDTSYIAMSRESGTTSPTDKTREVWDYTLGASFWRCTQIATTHNNRVVGAVSKQQLTGVDPTIYTVDADDGSAVSSFQLTHATYTQAHVIDLATDPSGNIYTCSHSTIDLASTSGRMIGQKYNSSGTLQWSLPIADLLATVDVDDTGTSVWGGHSVFSGFVYLSCYNSSGTLQWSHSVPLPSQLWVVRSCAIAPDGYVYCVKDITGGVATLHKFALSTGTETTTGSWPITIGSYGAQVVADGDSNLYLLKRMPGTLVKYNNSGTQQWSTNVGMNNYTDACIDNHGNILVNDWGGSRYLHFVDRSDGTYVSKFYPVAAGVGRSVASFPGRVGAWG